jgi:hypothetical protein
VTAGWQPLGKIPPSAISDARLSLHHAAQIVSAVGITHLPPAADDSHTNLGWTGGALAGHPIPGERAFHAAIRPSELTLQLLDGNARRVAEQSLFGRTLDDGYAWMAEAIARYTGQAPTPLTRPPYQLPEHPAFGGERFGSDSEPGLLEMTRWYADAAALLAETMPKFAGASPVRCWPHHFDIAMLLPAGGPEKSVGVGLSPGDGTYPQPYWYVSPYPYPEEPALSPLPSGGDWHRGDFFAAVLTGCDLVAGGAEEEQEMRSRAFLDAAVEACLRMLV